MRQSLNEYLLSHLVQDPARQTANSMLLARLLEARDCAGLRELFGAFFASIPYQRYAAGRCRRTNNDIANYEGFYASVFYSYFAALGYEITLEESPVEESSSHGRLDMAVRAGGQIYLFEFKVVELAPAGAAGVCAGAVAGARLRGQVPRRGATDRPDRGGVQPRHPQRDRVRGGARLTAPAPSPSPPLPSPRSPAPHRCAGSSHDPWMVRGSTE